MKGPIPKSHVTRRYRDATIIPCPKGHKGYRDKRGHCVECQRKAQRTTNLKVPIEGSHMYNMRLKADHLRDEWDDKKADKDYFNIDCDDQGSTE